MKNSGRLRGNRAGRGLSGFQPGTVLRVKDGLPESSRRYDNAPGGPVVVEPTDLLIARYYEYCWHPRCPHTLAFAKGNLELVEPVTGLEPGKLVYILDDTPEEFQPIQPIGMARSGIWAKVVRHDTAYRSGSPMFRLIVHLDQLSTTVWGREFSIPPQYVVPESNQFQPGDILTIKNINEVRRKYADVVVPCMSQVKVVNDYGDQVHVVCEIKDSTHNAILPKSSFLSLGTHYSKDEWVILTNQVSYSGLDIVLPEGYVTQVVNDRSRQIVSIKIKDRQTPLPIDKRYVKPLGQAPQEIVTVNFAKGDLVKFLPYTVLGSDFAPNPNHTWSAVAPDGTLVKLTKKPGDRAILTEVLPGSLRFKEGEVTYEIVSQFVQKCPQPVIPIYRLHCSDGTRRLSYAYKKGDKAVLVLTDPNDQVIWQRADNTDFVLKSGDVITVDLDAGDSVIIELLPSVKSAYNNADLTIHKTKIVPFDEAAQALKMIYTPSTLLDKELHDKLHLIASQRQTTVEKIAKSLLVTYLGNPDQQVYLTDGFPADPTPPPNLVTALNSVLDDLYPKVLEEARQQGLSFIDTLKGIVDSHLTMASMAGANPGIQFIDESNTSGRDIVLASDGSIHLAREVTLDQIAETVDAIVAKRLGENKPKRSQYEHKFVDFTAGGNQNDATLAEVNRLGKLGWRVANSRLINNINRVVFYRERKPGLTPKEIIALAFGDTRGVSTEFEIKPKVMAKKAVQARIALLDKWRKMRSKFSKDEQAKFVRILRQDLDMSIDSIATGLGLSPSAWTQVEAGVDTWVFEVMERIGDFYKKKMQPAEPTEPEPTPPKKEGNPNLA